MNENRPNHDGRVFGTEPGEPDYHIPGSFPQKVLFVVFALAITALGAWMIWAPLTRLVLGETSEGRVVRIVRTEPGVEDEVIRYKKDVPEQDYTVVFQHYVAVQRDDGTEHVMRLGVDAAKMPYAAVTDTMTVLHFPDGEVAFGAYQHRTWAFGAGYLSVGLVLSMLSINSLIMVGRKIPIDPESEESLEEERKAALEAEEWYRKRAAWKRGEPVAEDPPSPPPPAATPTA